jgi:cytochrome c biogenesis protein CcdA
VLRLLILVVSIAFGDSLNPSTVAPALYLASTDHPRRHLGGFILGVFSVTLLGGLLIMLGPGQLLLALIPQPSATAKYVTELVAGVAILALAAVLWLRRKAFARRKLPTAKARGGSSLALGAGIAAIELPTALPYLAAIALITGSGFSIAVRLGMLVAFNLVFVLPLLAILLTVELLGEDAGTVLGRANRWLQRRWPVLLAGLGALIGLGVLAFGLAGISGASLS